MNTSELASQLERAMNAHANALQEAAKVKDVAASIRGRSDLSAAGKRAHLKNALINTPEVIAFHLSAADGLVERVAAEIAASRRVKPDSETRQMPYLLMKQQAADRLRRRMDLGILSAADVQAEMREAVETRDRPRAEAIAEIAPELLAQAKRAAMATAGKHPNALPNATAEWLPVMEAGRAVAERFMSEEERNAQKLAEVFENAVGLMNQQRKEIARLSAWADVNADWAAGESDAPTPPNADAYAKKYQKATGRPLTYRPVGTEQEEVIRAPTWEEILGPPAPDPATATAEAQARGATSAANRAGELVGA